MEVVSEFQLIAVTPPGPADSSVAIAASRAGAVGVVDLQYCRNERLAISAVERLAQFGKDKIGIKLDSGRREFAYRVFAIPPKEFSVAILTASKYQGTDEIVRLLRLRNIRILWEAVCLEEARWGELLGVDGVIAKGHESGGRVGEETTFVLLQRLLCAISLPVWAHGGIGLHTAAACYAAGAAGAVLDGQLALTQESTLPADVMRSIARMDGSETVCLGQELDTGYRVYVQPGFSGVDELRRAEKALAGMALSHPDLQSKWRHEVESRAGWGNPKEQVWLLGQDAAFASSLAKRFRTVGGVIEGMRRAIDQHVRTASVANPLGADSSLARSLGTQYPILQGPMTRVSDKAAFASEVARGGALPFLALALMRAQEIGTLLEETRGLLGDRPWGVGILGFVPAELREEQLQVVRSYRPPFALIAGGRPDQALSLEQAGIPTYLHVPSPRLLELFLEGGARRFVFEGRECGGHVGPRSSFVLWDSMIEVLLKSKPEMDLSGCHVIFAGGIHDCVSAAMVATMAAPLTERGVSVGVLLGTAYIFTQEAVATGAIVPAFQKVAIDCRKTVLLETGVGHATRCADTRFAELFRQEKQQLLGRGVLPEEIRATLEQLNLGRLRIASKGMVRAARYGQDGEGPKLVASSYEEQRTEGMYMLGQVAALRDSVCSIAELHRDISIQSSEVLRRSSHRPARLAARHEEERPCDLAIVGMSCLLPKAPDLRTYWDNILNKVDAITEIPGDRWDWQRYFDADPASSDRIYSKWGGFLEDVVFDPLRYGIPPSAISSIEPLQLLTLELVRMAMEDAGCGNQPSSRQRTSVIFGAGGGMADLGSRYAVRSWLPELFEEVPASVLSKLPEWTEDSFAGILLNVVAGRVANRFDLGGVNFTVDAACASSLAALYVASKELETRASDVVIVGGVDTVQNPFGYLCFSKTRALSPKGSCSTFDEDADGIVISEGLVAVVLKRLADAEAAGDRIYAVVKGIGGSSDGRARGLTAPSPDGQASALHRAYTKARFSPATVGLVEAHGTGTVAGDQAEIESLTQVFEAAGARRQSCAIGSVKSMIGHTKCAAGMAGLVKVAMALHSKVLPPTVNVSRPNVKARSREGPLYVNTESRPWINGSTDHPRRAGVSAFGFGGTNFHAVLEEYTGDFLDNARPPIRVGWSSELLVWRASSRGRLMKDLESLESILAKIPGPTLRDLASTLWRNARVSKETGGFTLALVCVSLDDLRHKLEIARRELQGDRLEMRDPGGIYFAAQCPSGAKVAFLFPGQGSQYPGMLSEPAMAFPEVRTAFERADRVLASHFAQPLSSFIFSPPAFGEDEQIVNRRALTETNVAQPALGAAGVGLFSLLQNLRVQPDFVAGHSYGEYAALFAAGVFDQDTLYKISEARGRFILEEAGPEPGTMAAVSADSASVAEVIDKLDGIWIANRNTPQQTVISGTREGMREAIAGLKARGFAVNGIPTACAFHSPLMARARKRLAEFLSAIDLVPPRVKVFSNTTGEMYPADPVSIAALLAEHLVKPVEFTKEIETMYRMGARVFVEVGPNSVLTGLIDRILGNLPHLAVPCDRPVRSGVLQLHHALAQLMVAGVVVNLDRWYEGLGAEQLDLNSPTENSAGDTPSSVWLVNGSRAKPAHASADINRPTGREKRSHVETSPVISTPAVTGDAGRSIPKVSENGTHPAQSGVSPSLAMPSLDVSHIEDAGGEVLIGFQRLMKKFFVTQQAALTCFLAADTNGAAVSPCAQSRPTAPPMPNGAVVPKESGPEPKTSHAALKTDIEPKESLPAPTPAASLDKLILRIVADRTGYPQEVLSLDADIEADLGIDSIKKVEIIGALERECFPQAGRLRPDTLDHLTKSKKLSGIVNTIAGVLEQPEVTRGSKPFPALRSDTVQPRSERALQGSSDLPRFVLRAQPRSQYGSLPLPPRRVFLFTDDEGGIADRVAEKLRGSGGRIALLRMGSETGQVAPGIYTADLANPGAVAAVLDVVHRQEGPLAGLVHLLPLKSHSSCPLTAPAQWPAQVGSEVKSLFYLTKAIGEDLRAEGKAGRPGWLVAATWRSEGLTASSQGFRPGHGGIAGLVKSVAQEWPHARCKVLDFSTDSEVSEVADFIAREIVDKDSEAQISYQGARRFVLRPEAAPLRCHGPSRICLDSNSVVLVTGGARGITAEVALELAERYRPTLLLVGRSPLPESEEASATAGIGTRQELIRTIVESSRRGGRPMTPASAEARCESILQDRETRSNLDALRRAGAKVHYYQLDVRNQELVGGLIADIYRTHGRLDGVIHGAGVIEDKLIEAKSPESFDRVFDTKVGGAYALARHLRPESLQFLAFFSSVAGRFGNRGQADYAAANEALNELARYLDGVWAARVVAFNWGPWTGKGMVSSAVARQFESRGVQLISTEAGRQAFDAELRYGTKGQPEVIFGTGPWASVETPSAREPQEMAIVLALQAGQAGGFEFVYQLNLASDLYLNDHRLDGRAVMPAMMAAELMAEVAGKGWPEWEVVGIRAFQLLKGIIVSNGDTAVRVVANLRTRHDKSFEGLEIDTELYFGAAQNPAYKGIVLLGSQLAEPPEFEIPAKQRLSQLTLDARDAYQDLLFHGPRFHCLRGTINVQPGGCRVNVQASAPSDCLARPLAHSWMIDPILLDAGPQLAIVWARTIRGLTALPSEFDSLQRFMNPDRETELTCFFEVSDSSADHSVVGNVYFVNRKNRLVLSLRGLRSICSRALNRLRPVSQASLESHP